MTVCAPAHAHVSKNMEFSFRITKAILYTFHKVNDYKNWRLQFNQECMRFEQCYRNGMLVLCHVRFYQLQVPHQSCYLSIMQNSICIQFRQMYPTQQVLQQIKIISLVFHFLKALLHSVLLPANTVCETDVNTLRTGDENSRLWRFFFTTVKDRWCKFAF
jgi:hypothetical protein